MALALALLVSCATPAPSGSGSPSPEVPHPVAVTVVERGSGAPLAGAVVRSRGRSTLTDAAGRATLLALPSVAVVAAAGGHDPASAPAPAGGELRLELRPNVVGGRVTDAAGKPLAGVRVFVDGGSAVARTDPDGRYRLLSVPERGTLIYKLAGYRLGTIPIDATMTKDVAMQPFQVRALYAPSAIFEVPGRLDALLALIDKTEANAMVIDVKETDGKLYWATDLPAARQVGALMPQPLFRLDELLPKLKARGIYTIARMVVMKDNTLGAAQPQLAVRNTRTGKPWTDYGGGIWLDPYSPGVDEYITAVATDLADKGFDEVQLDYVRFFSDGDYSVAGTTLPNAQSFRLPAMRRLFRMLSTEFEHRRAFLGADVFPISFIAADDQGIGQRPEVIMPYVDYFCPMVYPSHYDPGTFGFTVPNDRPYEVIDDTLKIMNVQAKGLPMKIRPWIQDFGYGPFAPYDASEVRAEMKALRDNGTEGWMIWNAQARFTTAALGPPVADEAAGPMTSAQPASSAPADTTSPAATSPAASASAGP